MMHTVYFTVISQAKKKQVYSAKIELFLITHTHNNRDDFVLMNSICGIFVTLPLPLYRFITHLRMCLSFFLMSYVN